MKMQRHIANILGDNKFFLGGTKPTLVDCAIFGFMSHRLFSPGPCSKFFKPLMTDKSMENLVRHTEMMRELYWLDWEQCKFKSNLP